MNYDLTARNERAPLKARELEGEARKALAYSRFSQKDINISACGRDAEVRYTPSSTAICNVSVATSSRRKDKASGESIEDTQWHRVTFYERLAEILGEYLKKGKPVYIEGRLKYGRYTDKDGIERNTADIAAEPMQMLGDHDDGPPARPRPGRPPASTAWTTTFSSWRSNPRSAAGTEANRTRNLRFCRLTRPLNRLQ